MTQNFISPRPEYEKYRGLRGLMLTRVSTGSQSHAAQERVMREGIIEPLEIVVDDRVVHDTYTGLDYRYRKALDDIIRRAERKEFEVLCVEAIDRGLGRGAIGREVFLGQLWELDIHVISTDPNDHVDDRTPEGMTIRVMHGYKDEKEVKDFVRRTKNAKRDKALGNPAKGIPPKVIGNGSRLYGFKYVRDEKGKVETLELNYETVFVDKKGVVWTEVRVAIFIFRCAKRRIPLRQIAIRLNEIGIPVPYISTGRNYKSRGVKADKLRWQVHAISRICRNTTYSGRKIVNGQRVEKVPGLKYPRHVKTAPEEQIIVPVPEIVSVELQEEVIRNMAMNKTYAMRNNQQKIPALMRSGLAKCGNCGRTAIPRVIHKNLKGGKKEEIYYLCSTTRTLHKCKGCHIIASTVDREVWKAAIEIINDPNIVDVALAKKKEEDPTASRRKQIKKRLEELQDEREALQADFIRLSKARMLDRNTEARLTKELKELEQLEYQYNSELADDEIIRRAWDKTQREVERLHRKCETMREKLKNPDYQPSYKDKRDMVEYFGMTVILWENGHVNEQTGEPQRIKIEARFADVVMQPSPKAILI